MSPNAPRYRRNCNQLLFDSRFRRLRHEPLEDRRLLTAYFTDDVPVPILDRATVTSTLQIPDHVTVADINVQIWISHTRNEDLDVFLIAPDSTRVELFSDIGNGSNFRGTILDDEANDSIAPGYGKHPFPYRFQPEGRLSDFDGKDAQGTWTLEITDDRNKEVGTLDGWWLEVLTPGPTEFTVLDAGVTEGNQGSRFIDEFVRTGIGGLDHPRQMTWGPNGDIYVSSAQSDEVLRYDGATGAFMDVFVSAGSGGLDSPSGLLFDDNGNLYVANAIGANVLRYQGPNALYPDYPGEFMGEFVATGSGGLETPNGLTLDDNGDLYVSDFYAGAIRRYAGPSQPNAGQSLGDFVPAGSGGLDGARRPLFHPDDGNLYVVSTASRAILRYQGPDGATPGAFMNEFISMDDLPTDMILDADGRFYVGSGENGYLMPAHRVRRYQGPVDESPGAYIDQFVSSGTWGMLGIHGMLLDANGNLYVGSSLTDNVLRYGPASQAVVYVMLSSPSSVPISVDYSLTDGSARAGSDYTPVTGTVWFDPGVTWRTIVVPTIDDDLEEDDETFVVTLSNPSSGTSIADGEAVVTIYDTDVAPPPPSISIDDVQVTEGDSGTTTADFTVTRSGDLTGTVTVDYTTADNTATAPADYVAVSTTQLTFSPSETTKTVSVTVNGDTEDEGTETFFVNLSNVSVGAITDSQGVATIVDDDQAISTMHVGDLDASSTRQGSRWTAFATITVHDDAENPVTGATVTGAWSGGTSGSISCTTDAVGLCTVKKSKIPMNAGAVTFTVTTASGPLNYDSSVNHDVDGDSDGTTINVNKPLHAVVAAVKNEPLGDLLSQSMVRPVVDAAISHWAAEATADELGMLSRIDVEIADLNGSLLGLAYSDWIVLDRDAAGYGWSTGSTISGALDLLPVVTHEIGHLLGYGHSAYIDDVMAATLPVGTRRLTGTVPVINQDLMGSVLASPLLFVDPLVNGTHPNLVDHAAMTNDAERNAAADHDRWLLPSMPADYVNLPRTRPEAVDVRVFDDITDEETELLDEELLDLIAAGQK